MSVWLAVIVLLAATALDYAYVRYQDAVARRHSHAAGMWSVTVYLVGAVGFLSVIEGSMWYMVPECLGLYLGTTFAMRGSR
jgi:uncharacterized membrane protein